MCGLSGIISLKDSKKVPIDELVKMNKLISHRGPDDEGYMVISDGLKRYRGEDTRKDIFFDDIDSFDENSFGGLGFRRLSIIDMGISAHQPMLSGCGRYAIIFNGEIFNYKDLRGELEQEGVVFRSNSDTEVALQSYIRWGSKCLHQFNGMWAFCVFDKIKNAFFLSRDRYGIKPLYYTTSNDLFYFASELKQFEAIHHIEKKVNDNVMLTFLTTGEKDSSEETFFSGIKQLQPGCSMYISRGKVEIDTYWKSKVSLEFKGSESESILSKFKDALESSVKLRMNADVEVGVALSGGLDSSIITILASRYHQDARVKSFSVNYKGTDCDESHFAREVIRETGCESVLDFPSGVDCLNDLNDLVYQLEEPFRSLSSYSQWRLMKKVKENGIAVLLEGQGADEILGGYHWYIDEYLYSLLSKGKLLSFYKASKAFSNNYKTPSHLKIFKVVLQLLKRVIKRFHNKGGVYSKILPGLSLKSLSNERHGIFDELDFSINGLIRELLNYGDKNSMGFSVENRVPFLDFRVVEMCLKSSLDIKFKDGKLKYILRHTFGDELPSLISNRFSKLGFAAPYQEWMRRELSEEIQSVLTKENIQTLRGINVDEALNYIRLFYEGKHNDDGFVWRLYSVLKWKLRFGVG